MLSEIAARNVPEELTSTAKVDLKAFLKGAKSKGILMGDHSNRVSSMTDGEALSLLISVVKRTL